MNRIKGFLVVIFAFAFINTQAQIFLNEVSNRNSGQIYDFEDELNDWIEIINYSGSATNLENYYLSDDPGNPEKWKFPSYFIEPAGHLIVFASGKNLRNSSASHWESPVLSDHTFDFIVPSAATSTNWKLAGFDVSGWGKGKAGFGYGDNDDSTLIVTESMSVYIRKSFILPSDFSFEDVEFQVDYDDGFVAYLNGTEIARRNISGTPAWNSPASDLREALIYTGGKPESISVDSALVSSILVTGENIFAIEVHNIDPTSSDMSLIPFLSFKISNAYSLFDRTPSSLIASVSNELHTNFKIDSKGERISLLNKNTGTLDSIWVKDLSFGWSIGRQTDASATWGIFTEPTPGSANANASSFSSRESDPVFSIQEGYYTGTQYLSLTTSSPTAEIRYTTDGSEPISTSLLYTGNPITIATTRVIRACTFSKSGLLPGHSIANTYFINISGNTVPVLSVMTANNNLYGGTGIFDNWSQDWEKPAYVEYFDVNKTKQFEQFTGIRMDGGAGGSRSQPQHSFRLEFSNNSFGDGDIDYLLLPDRPKRTEYKSIYLRNGSNQYLTFPFKDAMECSLTSYKTKNDYSHCTPVVVYINGFYFGLYELREKINDEYFEENYKANVDSAFHLLSLSYWYGSVLRALEGSVDTFTSDYNRFLSLAPGSSDFLTKANEIIDLEYYTDYIIAQSWIADTDWPFNNIKIVKGDFTGYRWRFILQDLEWALNPNGWTSSSFDHINYMINYDNWTPYLRFWKELMKNPTYKRNFINRFADVMNTSYLPVNTLANAQKFYDLSYPEMYQEYVKWGGGTSQANTWMIQYANNLTTFKNELKNRTNVVRNNIVSNYSLSGYYSLELNVKPAEMGFINLNTITPEVYPWTGTYFAGVPVSMEAVGIGNYVFDFWEANPFITDVKNPKIQVDPKLSGYKFVANFKVQTPVQAIAISEINYASSDIFPTSDWIELYNYGSSSTDLTGWYIKDEKADHIWVLLGNYILKPGERLVLTSDINNFNDTYPDVQNVMGSFTFGFGAPSDSVQLFNNENKLIAGVKYNIAAPWPTGAYDEGKTLELIDPNKDINQADNWFAGCIGGSPGLAYSDCDVAGFSSHSGEFTIDLYPNPAKSEITVLYGPELLYSDISYCIIDVMGRKVIEEIVYNNPRTEIVVSLSGLKEGIYILQLSNGEYQQNRKFVKIKE
jgi:hypothetical protein